MGLLDDAIREHLELKRRRGADPGEISRQESDALGPVRRTAEGAPDLSDLPAVATPAAEVVPAHEPVAEAPPVPWEDERTEIHEAPASYEPPPIPPAPAAPPTAHEPPPVPAAATYEPPAPAPPAYEPPAPPAYEPPSSHDPAADPDFDPFPELADEPPIQPAPQPERGSLLSRFMRGRREHQPEPEPDPAAPPAADEPPTRDYAQPPTQQSYASPAPEPDIVPADDEPDGEDLLEETPDFLEETPEHDRLWFEQRPPRDFDFDG